MKTIYFVITTAFIFFSCEKVDDDSNEICNQNCTTLYGKVYSQNNTPLKNVAMTFKFQTNDAQNNNIILTRILSKVSTNNLGEFNMNFYLKDEELGELVGSFILNADKNTIPNNVFYEDQFNLFDNLYNIPNRDIFIQRNLYIPTFKKVKIKLNGFNSPTTDDYFRVLVEVPCGFDLPSVDSATGNNHEYATMGLNKYQLNNYNNLISKTFEVLLALNETNFIVLGRMKNNIYSEERIPIQVSSATDQTLEYNYE